MHVLSLPTYYSFVLVRDGGVSAHTSDTAAARPACPLPTKSIAISSYKGRGRGCEVAGLWPNTLYRFRLRAVNARTQSALSAPLEVTQSKRQQLKTAQTFRPHTRGREISQAYSSRKLPSSVILGLDSVGKTVFIPIVGTIMSSNCAW